MAIEAQVLLVTAEYVKKYTHLNDAVDQNLIHPSIYAAQDMYIESVIGTDLIVKIKEDTADSSISGNYETLRDKYIRPALAWWVMVDLLPHLAYKMDNGNLVQRTSEDTSPIDDARMKDLKDQAINKARHYTQRLSDYLCAKSSLFPEFSSNTEEKISPVLQPRGRSSVLFSDGNTAMSKTQNDGTTRLSQLPLH